MVPISSRYAYMTRISNATTDTDANIDLSHEDTPLAKSDNARAISKNLTIANPDQVEFSISWGQEQGINMELELDSDQILPSESLDWLQVSHRVRLSVVFADSKVRNLVVLAPFQIGHVVEESWSMQPAPEGITPPDYCVNDDQSTLLDSNTTRMSRQQLRLERYPEREHIVPDLAGAMPPVYEYEMKSR